MGYLRCRVEYQSNIYRIFGCFDEGEVGGSLKTVSKKKTQKTPKKRRCGKEAERLLKEYFSIKETKTMERL